MKNKIHRSPFFSSFFRAIFNIILLSFPTAFSVAEGPHLSAPAAPAVERVFCFSSQLKNSTLQTMRTDVSPLFIAPSIRFRNSKNESIFSDITLVSPFYSDGLTAWAWLVGEKQGLDKASVAALVKMDLPSRSGFVIQEWSLKNSKAWGHGSELIALDTENQFIQLSANNFQLSFNQTPSVKKNILGKTTQTFVQIVDFIPIKKSLLLQLSNGFADYSLTTQKTEPIKLAELNTQYVGHDQSNYFFRSSRRNGPRLSWSLLQFSGSKTIQTLSGEGTHPPLFHFTRNKPTSDIWITEERMTGDKKEITVRNLRTKQVIGGFPDDIIQSHITLIPLYENFLKIPFSSEVSSQLFYSVGAAGGIVSLETKDFNNSEDSSTRWKFHSQNGPGNQCVQPRLTLELPWPE